MSPPRSIVIPTPEQVSEYAAGIGFKLDGGYFCDYWESRGWMVRPGILMRSWQAAVRNWKRMADQKAAGNHVPAEKTPEEIRRHEAAERRMRVITEAAGRIRAMMSWIKSGEKCPWSSDPQGEIDDEVAKIKDHYGPKGVDDLRAKVKELGRKNP